MVDEEVCVDAGEGATMQSLLRDLAVLACPVGIDQLKAERAKGAQ
jgi:hypothetical protein